MKEVKIFLVVLIFTYGTLQIYVRYISNDLIQILAKVHNFLRIDENLIVATIAITTMFVAAEIFREIKKLYGGKKTG